MKDSRELSRQECVDLLAAGTVARVAVTTPDGPHIVPVNYSVHGDAVLVRTSAYSLLGTYARDAVVALEIDGFEPGSTSGWSVVLRGRCSVETDPRAIREILSASAGGPWAGGTRNLFLRLRTDQVSGRAVGDLTPAATQQALEALESRSAGSGSTDAFFGA